MITDVITVSGTGMHLETALREADRVAAYREMTKKDAIHLRLLVEEMMGMVRAIAGNTDAQFWMEAEKDEYRLHLRFLTGLDPEKREKLLSAASSGRNENAKGFTGRLRSFFNWCFCSEPVRFSDPLMLPDVLENATNWEWSMARYERTLAVKKQNDPSAQEAWDELEKSVVAHVADDVKVFIRNSEVEMVIIKKLSA